MAQRPVFSVRGRAPIGQQPKTSPEPVSSSAEKPPHQSPSKADLPSAPPSIPASSPPVFGRARLAPGATTQPAAIARTQPDTPRGAPPVKMEAEQLEAEPGDRPRFGRHQDPDTVDYREVPSTPTHAVAEGVGDVRDLGDEGAKQVAAADSRPRFGTRIRRAEDFDGPPSSSLNDDAGEPAAPARASPGELLGGGPPKFGSGGGRSAEASAYEGLDTQEIVGRLDNLRTINDWAVGTIWHPERRQVKITGTGLGELVEGLEYLFVGYPKVHPQHGEHLEVVAVTPHISAKPMAVAHYISNCFTGIGIAKADKYVKEVVAAGGPEALESLRKQLINDPYSLDLTEVAPNAQFRPKGAGTENDEIDLGLGRQSVVYRELATRLGGVPGMKGNVLKSLATWLIAQHGPYDGGRVPPGLAERCWATLALDPYAPMKEVSGYAWVSAETIGREVRVPRDLPRRLSAMTEHALGLGCANGGHAFLTLDQLRTNVAKLDSRVEPDTAIAQSVDDGLIIIDDKARAYRPEILRAEVRLAQGIAELLVPGEPLIRGSKEAIDAKIADVAKALGIGKGKGLDPSQLDSVSRILRSAVRIHTLTGGPGCGKTTVMEVLAKMLPGKDIVFATPTGKSAKVLHARVSKHGLSVATLHSTLGCQGEDDFRHGPDEPIDADGFVIDESSMPDLVLSDAAVAALADGAHLVLVGDPDQLESIGPGRVLKDILQLEGVDHNRLTATHRNGGAILRLVDSIREGEIDFSTEGDDVEFSHGLGDAAEQMGEVAAAYVEAVERSGFANVMLLMSRRKGDVETPGWNATYANAYLQRMCNPNAPKITGTNYHIGDRIIIRERLNLEQRDRDGNADPGRLEMVVNGDVGTIKATIASRKTSGVRASLLPQWIDIELDDGRTVNMPGACVNSLGHAYALTVHSAQGSEYAQVILVGTPGQASFVNRTMLLTGVSRTRQHIHVFAKDEDLQRIAATPSPQRNTALVERVSAALADEGVSLRDENRMRA